MIKTVLFLKEGFSITILILLRKIGIGASINEGKICREMVLSR